MTRIAVMLPISSNTRRFGRSFRKTNSLFSDLPLFFFLWTFIAFSFCGFSFLPAKEAAEFENASTSASYTCQDVDDLLALQKEVQSVVETVTPAVVGLKLGNSFGSGVVISEDGYILTAGHVIKEAEKDVEILFANGTKAKGKTRGCCRWADTGVVKITDPGKWPHADMANLKEMAKGQWCLAAGHPLGFQSHRPPVFRLGRLLQLQPHILQTDATIVAGDSGGPLFDLQGKVIGINSRILQSVQTNFHVSISLYHDFLERMKAGEVWGGNAPGKDSLDFLKSFEETIQKARDCVVSIQCSGKEVALGTIIGPDGWILTKASELSGDPKCLLKPDVTLEAEVVGIDHEFDLALLKVETNALPQIPWQRSTGQAPPPPLEVGTLIACPEPTNSTPLVIGIVGVSLQEIPPIDGVIGVIVADDEEGRGAIIRNVIPHSPAEKAGLQVGDIITHVDGVHRKDHSQLIEQVKNHRPGEKIQLLLIRDDETMKIELQLARILSNQSKKREMQNETGVGISIRRDGFAAVFQHDAALPPSKCGGPVVSLDGKVVGINIARGGRVETYAIPTEVVLSRLYDLFSGNLRPSPSDKQEPSLVSQDASPKENAPVDQ